MEHFLKHPALDNIWKYLLIEYVMKASTLEWAANQNRREMQKLCGDENNITKQFEWRVKFYQPKADDPSL